MTDTQQHINDVLGVAHSSDDIIDLIAEAVTIREHRETIPTEYWGNCRPVSRRRVTVEPDEVLVDVTPLAAGSDWDTPHGGWRTRVHGRDILVEFQPSPTTDTGLRPAGYDDRRYYHDATHGSPRILATYTIEPGCWV
jgi:hypothetical protein